MKDYFGQPLDVKMQDARQSDNYGYEPQGSEIAPRPDTVDGYESLKVMRREFLKGSTDLTTASELAETDLFFDFSRNAHAVTMMMTERLSDEVGLEGGDRFEAFHNDKVPSLTNLTPLRYPKHDELKGSSVGQQAHRYWLAHFPACRTVGTSGSLAGSRDLGVRRASPQARRHQYWRHLTLPLKGAAPFGIAP
jgi:hypothetical protein